MRILLISALTLLILCTKGQVVLNTINTAVTEDFNTLTASPENGLISPAILPSGWIAYENGINRYKISNGASTTGNLYSYGSIGASDRAYGSLRASGGATLYFGASFQNNTGVDINFLEINYYGEQWRRTSDLSDSLVFEISYDATTLTDGTWQTYSWLGFNSIVSGTNAALNGNLAANRKNVSGMLYCYIPAGTGFLIRFRDDNGTNNAGLAIDDFSLTPRDKMHFYDNGTNYTNETNWGINTDGTGLNPLYFNYPFQYFHIKNFSQNLTLLWNLSDGVDSAFVVIENTTDVYNNNIAANFILNSSSVTNLYAISNFHISSSAANAVINYYGSSTTTQIKLNNPGIVNLLNSNTDLFELATNLQVQTELNIYAYLKVLKNKRISGTVNVRDYGIIECERQNAAIFNVLDNTSMVVYSGVDMDIADTIKNYNYGILKVVGKIDHLLSENIQVNNYFEATDMNYTYGNGAFDFNNFKITGNGDFVAHNDATLLVRDSLGLNGSVTTTGTKQIFKDVSIGYIGANVKYSGNPFLTEGKFKILGNAGPTDLILTEDFGLTNAINAHTGDIDLNGHIVYLDSTASVIEDPGFYVKGSGYMEYIKWLGTINNNPAQIGINISADANLGQTIIRRGHAIQTGLGNQSIRRWFDIIPTNNTALNATLTVNYIDLPYYRNGLNENNFEFFRSTDFGTTWTEKPLSSVNTTDNTVSLTGISSFSRWTIGTSTSPLPVELLTFEIVCDNNNSFLKWSTASEINNAYFEVEQSTDGLYFYSYKTIQGKGNTNSTTNYLTQVESGYYYKLSQTDFDGKKNELGITFIECNNATITIIQDQNNSISINGIMGEFNYAVYALNGQLILKNTTIGTANNTILNLLNIDSGIYMLEVNTPSNSLSKKIRIIR